MKYKKLIICILPLLLTGCLGKTARGYLSSTCSKQDGSSNFTETTTYNIDFKEDKVNNVVITKEYSNNDLEEELKSQKMSFDDQRGIDVDITSNKIVYKIDMNKISSDMKNHFNLKDSYNDLETQLKKDGMTCE